MIRTLAFALWAVASSALAGEAPAPLPFKVGGAFHLTDQYGVDRTEADPDGHAQLLFFGYANCPGICTTAMPMMADVADLLADQNITVRPVMITVDPSRDKVGEMIEPLAKLHPDFVGLTGDENALAKAYAAFSVQRELAFEDPDYGPVYTHGSFIYLLDADGKVLTLFPPIQDAGHVAKVAVGYLAG